MSAGQLACITPRVPFHSCVEVVAVFPASSAKVEEGSFWDTSDWIPHVLISVWLISTRGQWDVRERYSAAFEDGGAGGEPDGGGPEKVPVGFGPWWPSCGIPLLWGPWWPSCGIPVPWGPWWSSCGIPVPWGPWKLTPLGGGPWGPPDGGPLCSSAGAAKTATGAKAATKRVKRVERCMLAVGGGGGGWVGVVEVLICKDVRFCWMNVLGLCDWMGGCCRTNWKRNRELL